MKGQEYSYHEPTQLPINPPYKEACYLRKNDLLAKPKVSAEDKDKSAPQQVNVEQASSSDCQNENDATSPLCSSLQKSSLHAE